MASFSITETATAGTGGRVGWGLIGLTSEQLGTELPQTVGGVTVNAIFSQGGNVYIELAGGDVVWPENLRVVDSNQEYVNAVIESATDIWALYQHVDDLFHGWVHSGGTYVAGQTYSGLITMQSTLTLNSTRVEPSSSYALELFQTTTNLSGATASTYHYFSVNPIETAAEIKAQATNTGVRSTDLSAFLSALVSVNGQDYSPSNTRFANFLLNEDYYLHSVIEDGNEIGIFSATRHIQIPDRPFVGFEDEKVDFLESVARKERADINRDKILFLYNSDTGDFADEENIVDDYIADYGLTSHKIGVSCNTAVNFAAATIWNSWMKSVYDYIEANDIEAIFLSPNFKHWIPYPGEITDGQSGATRGVWSAGCATQLAGSIPFIGKYLGLAGSTDYRDVDVDVLVSGILGLNADQYTDRGGDDHITFLDLVSYAARNDTGQVVPRKILHFGDTPVGFYSPDWSLSTAVAVSDPVTTGGNYSNEKVYSSQHGSREVLGIGALRAAGLIDRIPNGRLGAGAVTGTGNYTTGEFEDSPSITRAEMRVLTAKSQAQRGSIDTHKDKLIVASTILRPQQDISPQQAIISHKMYNLLGFTNMLTTAWSDSPPTGRESSFESNEAAIQLIAERSGDTDYNSSNGYSPDVLFNNDTGTGNTAYLNPGTGGDYSTRTAGFGINFKAQNSTTFPLPEVWMWLGQGMENGDKSSTGHFWNSGSFATLGDGACYQSATSFGMHIGRWFILEGGVCAVGALRMELETDPVAQAAPNNEIELMHHTSLEIDSSPQFQNNLLRGHTAAFAEFFQNWTGLVNSSGTGYAKSQELWGDPLYQPFALQSVEAPAMKIQYNFVCGAATEINASYTDGFGQFALGANVMGDGPALVTNERTAWVPTGTLGSGILHRIIVNPDNGEQNDGLALPDASFGDIHIDYTDTGGDTDEDVVDGLLTALAAIDLLNGHLHAFKHEDVNGDFALVLSWASRLNIAGTIEASTNMRENSAGEFIPPTGVNSILAPAMQIYADDGTTISNLSLADLGATTAANFAMSAGFCLIVAGSDSNGDAAGGSIGDAVPITSLRIFDYDQSSVSGSVPNIVRTPAVGSFDELFLANDFKAGESGGVGTFTYFRLSDANGAENRLIGLEAGRQYQVVIEFSAANLGITTGSGGGGRSIVKSVIG